jgi:deoxyribodipyrimidine photo-lyase
MNPWIQSAKYDPTAEYIKKWVPELRDVPVADIHHWDTKWENHKKKDYPKPMVDYTTQKELVLELYHKYI